MKRVVLAFAVLALLAGAALGDAPETGVVSGVVTDAEGSPLPGVQVTLTGDRGEQVSTTDENGRYHFALLPPGSYRIKAELEGLGTKEGVANLSAGGREKLDLELALATAEAITVTSEAPMVDKFNVTAGATVQAELGVQTAGTTRTYYGLINTLPGVASDPQNDDIQQTRPSVNGSHFADQQVFIDGVDTTFAKFGGSRVFLPTTAVTEVAMEAGGSSAEYGRAIGSSTNVIVKSGTNTFHGAGLVQEQKISWGKDYKDQPALLDFEYPPDAGTRRLTYDADYLKRSGIEEEGESTGYELSVGGPMVKDKAWFFVGWSEFDDNYVEKLLEGDPVDTSLNNEAIIGKVNFQPGAAHQLALSYIDTPASRVYFNPNSADYYTIAPHIVEGDLGSLNYNWSISKSLFLETKFARQTSTENKTLACGDENASTDAAVAACLARKQQDRGPMGDQIADIDGPPDTSGNPGDLRFPANPAMGPHWPGNNFAVYVDNNFSIGGGGDFPGSWHNGWILSDGFGNNDFPRDQGNAAMTQFIGANNELKYGVDYQETKWTGDSRREPYYTGYNFDAFNRYGYKGAGGLGNDTCAIARVTSAPLIAVGGQGRFCSRTHWDPAVFANLGNGIADGDSRSEVLAGFARDRMQVGDHWTLNFGLRAEQQSGHNDAERKVFEDTYVSPRAAATYDLKGDGRMLVSLNAGRYHALLNQEWIAQHLHDAFNGFNGLQTYLFCDPLDVIFVPACGGQVGYNFFLRQSIPGHMWNLVDQGVFDSDITPYYKDEAILGFEWQFTRNWALDAKAIYWSLENMIGATTQLGPDGEQFLMVANYDDYQGILNTFAQARAAKGFVELLPQSVIDGFEEGNKDYQAVQMQVNRRFSKGWAMYNNITWSETETTGAGAWWNNTNSDYGEDLHVRLTQANVDTCQAQQATRTVPVDCHALLDSHVGEPISTLNREGKDLNADRPLILHSVGFKTWSFHAQSFTLGGHLTFQSGLPWNRQETIAVTALNPDGTVCGAACVAANPEVNVYVEPIGARRNVSEYMLNLSGAYGFPMGRKDVRGTLRVEVINVTDQQRQRFKTYRGEARPVRRDFQRPLQARVSFGVEF
jgi:hypothetical protein